MQGKNNHLEHSLRPPTTPAHTNSSQSHSHTTTPTHHNTRSKDLAVNQSIDTLRSKTQHTVTNLDSIVGNNTSEFNKIRATCDILNHNCHDLRASFQTLQQNVNDYSDDELPVQSAQQQDDRLEDIESLALTSNMANASILNSVQMFTGYNSHDPKLWFIKLESYFRARKMAQETWLSAMNGFLSDTVIYAIEDIPLHERNTYAKLRTKLIEYYKLTPIARMNLSSELAKRFQLPGELVETFINDVVKQSKRLDFPAASIVDHLKRGFRAEVQRYMAIKPPHGDSLAALIQAAREAETMTVEMLDTTGIASQLKQLQEQITKIQINPTVNFVENETTDYNIPLPLPATPPTVMYRDPPRYQDNYRTQYRPRNTNYNNRGGFSNGPRYNRGNYRGGYTNSNPAPRNRYSAPDEYGTNRGGYGNASRGFTNNSRYFSRGNGGAIGGQRPPLAIMPPPILGPSTCRSCVGTFSHEMNGQCNATTRTCFVCGQYGHVAPACRNK
jgi:hypothetical protein